MAGLARPPTSLMAAGEDLGARPKAGHDGWGCASLKVRRRWYEMLTLTTLYHLAEEVNLGSIREHGLLSTARLLAQAGIPEAERCVMLRRHRPECVRLPSGVLIRDQKPMPPKALAPALDNGLTPPDWYELLNGHVFLWPDRDRLERQRRACRGRPQAVLVFDGARLLRDFGGCARVSPINSGNARRRPARRGLDTLRDYAAWAAEGWPDRRGGQRPAEVLFSCAIPARPPYLVRIERDPPAEELEHGSTTPPRT